MKDCRTATSALQAMQHVATLCSPMHLIYNLLLWEALLFSAWKSNSRRDAQHVNAPQYRRGLPASNMYLGENVWAMG